MADFDEIIGNKGFNKDRRETMLKFWLTVKYIKCQNCLWKYKMSKKIKNSCFQNDKFSLKKKSNGVGVQTKIEKLADSKMSLVS